MICHDTSRDSLERHGLSYVATRFVPGTLLSVECNDDLIRRAFSYLSDINRVTIDDVDEKLLREHDGAALSVTLPAPRTAKRPRPSCTSKPPISTPCAAWSPI